MNVNSIVGRRRDGRPIHLIRGGAPDATETLGRLCADGSTVAGGTPRQIVDSRIKFLIEARIAVLDTMIAEKRTMKASEQRVFDRSSVILAELEERRGEIDDQEERAALSARTRVMSGDAGPASSGWSVGREATTYHRGADSPSFFKDLRNSQRGDWSAAERLQRNNRETGFEARAMGNTGAAGGSGGEFAPPGWLIEDFVALARPGRVTADLLHKEELPRGVSSVNLPKVSTGSTTAVQSTQNSALSDTDPTTAALTSGIVTIGGKVVVSQQLLDQSPIPFDKVILSDLAADYAEQLDVQVLTGSGSSGQLDGILTVATGGTAQTWTQASPTGVGFYGQLAKLQAAINTARHKAPDTVVMSPSRWAWFASAVDGAGRPLVTPTSTGSSYNGVAETQGSVAAGRVGNVLGMQIVTDPLIPTNTGSGSNQDTVLMFIADDVWLWESEPTAEAITAPFADSLGVLFRLFGYSSLIANRYLTSLGTITGTGLVTPAFAS